MKQDGQCTVSIKVTVRSVRETIVAVEKQSLSATLVIHYAMSMRRIIRSSLSSLTLTYFFTLFHKRHERGGELMSCVLILPATLYESYILVFMQSTRSS
jgi:hypothetical protein